MDVARRVQLDTLEVGGTALLDADQLGQGDAAGTGQRRGVQAVATPVDAHRLTPFDAIVGQVLLGDQPAIALHLRDQQCGGLAFVEVVRTLVGDAFQRLGQLRLAEGRTRTHAAEVVLEVGRTVEQADGVLPILELLVGHREAFTGITDCRGDEFTPGQLAEALVGFPHTQHRARHAGCPGAHQAEVLDHLALIIQKHGLAGGLRRDFPVVQEIRLAVHVQGHETAAADIARLGIGDGQGKGGRYRRVHRVAAVLQDLGGHLGAVFIGSGNRPAFQKRTVSHGARRDDCRQSELGDV